MRRLARRLRILFARSAFDRELDDEMRLHLEQLTVRYRADGLDEAEARRRALRVFGRPELLRDEAHDARGLRPLEDLGRDVRIGLRTLAHRPGFAVVVVLTLGIGVGCSTAIFGVVQGILLRPLPYARADRVVAVWEHDRSSGDDRREVAPANFLDWRDRARAFERLTAVEPYGLDWQSPEGPLYLPTALVYERFFDVLGAPPLLGRGFRDDEHAPGRGDVVVIGHRLWTTRFGADRGIVGRVLRLDGRPHTVVGVMPEGFGIPGDETLWAPKVQEGWEKSSRDSHFYTVYGRLRDGVDLGEAAADLATIADALSREQPRTNADSGVALVPLSDQIVGGVRVALWVLFGAVVVVLAVVAASVASLQLARAASRRREFAVRAALGAGAWRVARQLLAENLILAALGTALGYAVAAAALGAIRAWAPADLPRASAIRADEGVLMFAATVSVLTVVLTGIAPALVAGRSRLQSALVPGSRTVAGSRVVARTQAALIVFQVCASLVLVVGAGLLIRSFVSILAEDRGFRTEGVVAVTVQSWSHYQAPGRAQFVRDVEARLAALPGVRAAGAASSVPLMEGFGAEQSPLAVVGEPPAPAGVSDPIVQYVVATPGLFRALAIPLRHGRPIDERDRDGGAPVALVNEAFVRRHVPAGDPLGRRLVLARLRGAAAGVVEREIVGVVGDVRRFALHESARPTVYLPHAQVPTGATAFVVWGADRPSDLVRQAKQAIWDVNPAMAIYGETTMDALVGASLQQRRFLLALLTGFAALALFLAAAGLYGLMSYVTAQRTREFGVRLALGAARGRVVSLVLRRGLALAAAGILLGLAGAVAAARLLAGMLYRVTPFDPLTFLAAAVVLVSAAAAASAVPAWRAAATDPITALREE